jgi:hypothetical protein
MNPKLRALVVVAFSLCELLGLMLVVPMVALTMTVYVLLLCVRAAGEQVVSLTSRTLPPPPGNYEPNTAGVHAHAGS